MHLLVGKRAPKFKAPAAKSHKIIDNFSLEQFEGKNIIFFFYPLDFTFVCPTELHAFEDKSEEFKKRNTQVVGCPVDSVYSHLAYLQTPKSKGGIEGVNYPIVSDITKSIARDFHVLSEHEGVAYRGLFLIDKKGVIRHQLVNDLPLGRSINEALRMIDALDFYEKNGEVCPANWQPGEKTMTPDQEGISSFF